MTDKKYQSYLLMRPYIIWRKEEKKRKFDMFFTPFWHALKGLFNNFCGTANSASTYLFKVKKGNSTIVYEICPKLTIKTAEPHERHRFGVFLVNFEQVP